jgi:hypothetical protein
MINALDFLLPNQRDAVLSYTPIAGGIGEQLKKASDKAAQRGDSLYLPGGLWLIKANNGRDPLSGWHINIPDNKSLLIFGDGDATIIRRETTETLENGPSLIFVAANDKINISFQNLLIDGNETNCPTDKGFTFPYDGTTRRFFYTTTDATSDGKLTVTLITNGVEAIQNRGGFMKGGIYPNRFVDFTVPPPSGTTTIRLYNIFAHEQSANVIFSSGTGTPNNVTFDNVTMTGCVGDGFKANVQIQSLQVINWRSFGRTRRPRADIQLSRIPLQATNITNFIGDAIGWESGGTSAADHVINLSNMLVRGTFALAGDSENHTNVNALNVTHLCQFGVGLPLSNFSKIRGKFVNCSFVDTRSIRFCQVKFTGGKFTVLGSKANPTIANDIKILGNITNDFVEFNDVEFDWEGNVTSGKFVSTTEKFASVSPVAEDASPKIIRFMNCATLRNLDYFASANRCKAMLFDGGQIGGRIAAIRIESADARLPEFVTNVTFNNPICWTSALVSIASAGDVGSVHDVKANVRIMMFGSFDAEILKPISNTAIETHENITWIGGFTAAVASDPNGRIRGLPGLILRKSEPASDEIVEWQYKQGKTYASMQYVP